MAGLVHDPRIRGTPEQGQHRVGHPDDPDDVGVDQPQKGRRVERRRLVGPTAKVLDTYAAHPGACAVDLLLCEAHEQRELVCSGRADMALLHLPFDAVTGLDTEALLTEGQVVVLPGDHPLAGRTAVSQAEVAAAPGPPPARWPAPDGSCPEGTGVAVRNLTQLFQLIALGRATVVLPASAAVDLRRDLVAVPVTDAPPVTTVLAWLPESRSRPVADLVRVAATV
ncbi:LysR substrate-binding domain-containing protein [Streptomyces globisporus]|uniref:LysR substrate-binding domain-containing protein n=1 Tax=Streptomyces TaxID=1883 RepID=UPI0005DB73EC